MVDASAVKKIRQAYTRYLLSIVKNQLDPFVVRLNQYDEK